MATDNKNEAFQAKQEKWVNFNDNKPTTKEDSISGMNNIMGSNKVELDKNKR